ncbi:Transcription factor [Malassezia brasiliensis]|uniref:Transcription factor n=1 Tax=Malassezia brasiliensis TaxID=1821822 RepID=A0AAF0DTJ9_9BASI|nr:Transcription factor [Malassezia brasiliensis]
MSRAAKREPAARPSTSEADKRKADETQDSQSKPASSPPKKKQSTRRKVNMACIYCRRSHMTCDENRPCQRCVKRVIGHLCRDEVTQPTGGAARHRNHARKTTEPQPIATPPLFQKTPGTSGTQEIHPHELNVSPAPGVNIARLDHDLGSSQTFSPDPLSASRLGSAYASTAGSQFGMAPQFPAAQDVSLMPPDKARVMDPNLSLFRPMPSLPSSANGTPANLEAVDVPPSRAPFGAAPARAGDLQGAQLGGTAWLGLGGGTGRASLAGDSGGGGELNVLSEFLESLDDTTPWYAAGEKPVAPPADTLGFPFRADAAPGALDGGMQRGTGTHNLLATPPSMMEHDAMGLDAETTGLGDPGHSLSLLSPSKTMTPRQIPLHDYVHGNAHDDDKTDAKAADPYPPLLAHDASKTERFLLTAADQTDGSRDERLRKVIQAKCEAGLLRPYNHVNGYARLNRWMEHNVSASSRRRILKPLSVFRPVFYSIAKKLTQYDLIYIEEAFERLLLDYDRVFSIQSIPACLWRRTGEIYKGNKEFADLVGVSIESLREGRLCIYELMAEESAVNYWEKYGSVSFDPSQKAVLTMCKLRTRNASVAHADAAASSAPTAPSASGDNKDAAAAGDPAANARSAEGDAPEAAAPAAKDAAPCITCCFSFTIRRDKWNVRDVYD